jgi:hypothetical protein
VKGIAREARYPGWEQSAWRPKRGQNPALDGKRRPAIGIVGDCWRQELPVHSEMEKRANSIEVGLSSNNHWS